MGEESQSLIPDPDSAKSNEAELPTASVLTNDDQPLVPADPNPLIDNGSLVPDSEVMESGEKTPEPAKDTIAAPAEKDDSYTVPPEPTNNIPVAGTIKEETPKKEKKPLNVKLLAIIGGGVVGVAAIALLLIFVVIPMIQKSGRTTLDNTIKSALVRSSDSDDAKYAIFNEEGEQLTDFIFTTATNFSDGYALVTDSNGERSGIVSAGGAMGVDFGKYESISKYGAVYEVTTENGGNKLIKGNDELITELADKLDYYEKTQLIVAKSNDKYYVIDANTGEKKLTYGENDKPTIVYQEKNNIFTVNSKNHIIVAEGAVDNILMNEDVKHTYDLTRYSGDRSCILLESNDYSGYSGVYYKGKLKEINSNSISSAKRISLYDSSALTKEDEVRTVEPCYFYIDLTADYNAEYRDGYKIMNDNFELVSRPYLNDSYTSLHVVDADHQMIKRGNYDNYTVDIIVEGRVTLHSSVSYTPYVIDNNYYVLSFPADKYQVNYCIYTLNGVQKSCSTEKPYTLDEFGNRLGYDALYDKDFKKIADIKAYDTTKLNNYYLWKRGDYVAVINPANGESLVNEGIYNSITYNDINDVYVGIRGDGSTDIINADFQVISSSSGKVDLRQNHYAVKGGTVTELFTLKGKKFYSYE